MKSLFLLASVAALSLPMAALADGVESNGSVTVAPVTSVQADLKGPQLGGSVSTQGGVNTDGGCYSGCKPPPSGVPGPLVATGLPGLVAGIGALWALARRRRQQV